MAARPSGNNNVVVGSSQELMTTKQVAEDFAGKFKFTKEDICKSFNVGHTTFENFVSQSIGERDFIKKGRSHKAFYTQEVVDRFGFWLKKNAISQGRQSEIIKQDNIGDMAIGFIFTKGSVAQQKDMLAFLQEKVAQQELLEQSNEKILQLEHALEYDKVKDWKAWNHLKKEIKYKGNFQRLIDDIPLVKDEDYVKKVMGNDNYPTTLISLTGEEKIIDFKECVLDEE